MTSKTYQHIDVEAVKAACEGADAVLRERSSLPGFIGAHARMALAIHTPYSLALAEEINRGTLAETTMKGLSAAVSDLIANFCDGLTDDSGEVAAMQNAFGVVEAIRAFLLQRYSGHARRAFVEEVKVDGGSAQ